tara:strand:+ start:5199 stop:5318 length:120 start_codon:yes stop_codon:yes gene_type:complete
MKYCLFVGQMSTNNINLPLFPFKAIRTMFATVLAAIASF